MKIKAISTIVAFDGGMVVINPGETGELREDLAQQEIDAGKAAKVKGKANAKAEATAAESQEEALEESADEGSEGEAEEEAAGKEAGSDQAPA